MFVRLRFAPSPSGYLHVGGARTALFNWLYARRHGGVFVLRIEDTDAERSSAESVSGILDSLRWLGISWDEGPIVGGPHAPYFQSERGAMYRAAADALLTDGHAYYCYCNTDELAAKRSAAEASGGGWIYDRTCRRRPPDELAALEAAGAPRAIRFFVPSGQTTFTDHVRGRITVAHDTIEDFVLVRSDGQPTYQLTVVVDDVQMAITHVVRADDHISNTPKQILLYSAMGAPVPEFAHVPLIMGPDKKRLSKRHGATSVGEYEKLGYLPDAMVNDLALLGWSPGAGNQEVFSREELVARFTLEGISGGNAVFDPEKLGWFNQQHILRTSAEALLTMIQPMLEIAGLWRSGLATTERAWILRVIDLVKSRVRLLPDFVAQVRPFLVDRLERDPAAVAKYLSPPDLAVPFSKWRERLETVEPFDAPSLEATLREVAETSGIKAGPLIHATRVAVTGQAVSPGLFEVLDLLGRDRVVARLAEIEW